MNTARTVRERKARWPEHYCQHPLCLFRTQTRDGYTPCPKHQRSEAGNLVVSSSGGVEVMPQRVDGIRAVHSTATAPLTREERLALHDPQTCQHPHCRPEF